MLIPIDPGARGREAAATAHLHAISPQTSTNVTLCYIDDVSLSFSLSLSLSVSCSCRRVVAIDFTSKLAIETD